MGKDIGDRFCKTFLTGDPITVANWNPLPISNYPSNILFDEIKGLYKFPKSGIIIIELSFPKGFVRATSRIEDFDFGVQYKLSLQQAGIKERDYCFELQKISGSPW